ncbi:MAG: ankyrin repeat domain-containing protein [Candidatus Berkiella sp.]
MTKRKFTEMSPTRPSHEDFLLYMKNKTINDDDIVRFMRAIIDGNTDSVQTYINMGANVNYATQYRHRTPLLVAIAKGHEEIVSLLLSHGADPNFCSGRGHSERSPLMAAVYYGDEKIPALLLENGADINRIVRSKSALTIAARKGSTSLVEFLIRNGAKLNHPELENPLIAAAQGGGRVTKKLMQVLVEHGANNPLAFGYPSNFERLLRFSSSEKGVRFLEEFNTILRPIDMIVSQFNYFYRLVLDGMQLDRKNLLPLFLKRKDYLSGCLANDNHLDRFAIIFFTHLIKSRNVGQALNHTILDCNPAFAYGQALSKLPDEIILNVAKYLPDYNSQKKQEVLLFSGARLERTRDTSINNMTSTDTCQFNKQPKITL